MAVVAAHHKGETLETTIVLESKSNDKIAQLLNQKHFIKTYKRVRKYT